MFEFEPNLTLGYPMTETDTDRLQSLVVLFVFPFFFGSYCCSLKGKRCNNRIKVGIVLRQVTLQKGHVCATTERGQKNTSSEYICIEF